MDTEIRQWLREVARYTPEITQPRINKSRRILRNEESKDQEENLSSISLTDLSRSTLSPRSCLFETVLVRETVCVCDMDCLRVGVNCQSPGTISPNPSTKQWKIARKISREMVWIKTLLCRLVVKSGREKFQILWKNTKRSAFGFFTWKPGAAANFVCSNSQLPFIGLFDTRTTSVSKFLNNFGQFCFHDIFAPKQITPKFGVWSVGKCFASIGKTFSQHELHSSDFSITTSSR